MRTTMSCLALLGMCIAAQPAEAQTSAAYPTAPVRLVVGFPPGGPTDIMARLFASNLAEGLNGNFVVDNRPGAGSTIATDLVAKAKPDGYTLLVATLGGQGISPSMYRNLPYDPVKDFAPVCQLASVPNVLVVHPGVPVKSVQELIAYAKERPGELNYANTGSGTSQHMAMELFKHMTGLNIVAVNYRGSAPAIVDLIAGRSQMMIDNTSALGPHIHAGKLRIGRLVEIARPCVPGPADDGRGGGAGLRDRVVVRPDGSGGDAARDRRQDRGRLPSHRRLAGVRPAPGGTGRDPGGLDLRSVRRQGPRRDRQVGDDHPRRGGEGRIAR